MATTESDGIAAFVVKCYKGLRACMTTPAGNDALQAERHIDVQQ
jgi:hypothetical protein